MRFMGRTYAAATAIMLAYSAFFSTAASAEKTDDKRVTEVTKKDVSGYSAAEICADMGIGVLLDDTKDIASQVAAAKKKGYGTVKISDGMSGHTEDTENWLAGLKKSVDAADEEDMYIVLSLDSEDLTAEESRNIWKQTADLFKKYDRKLLFEGDFFSRTKIGDKTDAAAAIRSISKDRVLVCSAAEPWSAAGFGADTIAAVSVNGKNSEKLLKTFERLEIAFVNKGIPVLIRGTAPSVEKTAALFAQNAKALGIAAVMADNTNEDKIIKTYKDSAASGTVFDTEEAEENSRIAYTGDIELKAGADGKYSRKIAVSDLLGGIEKDRVKGIRFTGSDGFTLVLDKKGTSAEKECYKKVISVNDIKGDTLEVSSSDSSGTRLVEYEVLVADGRLEPYTRYLQFSEKNSDGRCYARAVMMVKYEDVAAADSVKFTFDLDGKTASVTSAKYYKAVSQQGQIIEPDEGHVFVAAVISGVPVGITDKLKVTDIELVGAD